MNNEKEILSQIIKHRRSIFPDSYTTEEIPKEVIEQILESANYAPTHKLTQPWRFTVFRKEGKLRLGAELAKLYKETIPANKFLQKKFENIEEKARQSDCIITIQVQYHPDKLPAWEELAATACAVQNMWLTAESLHVGGYWSSPEMVHYLGDFLQLGENEKCVGLFYMGYHHEEIRDAVRTPITEKVRWVES